MYVHCSEITDPHIMQFAHILQAKSFFPDYRVNVQQYDADLNGGMTFYDTMLL